jgi:RNA 2',3'-cyclic 3'-phosphodiesterase
LSRLFVAVRPPAATLDLIADLDRPDEDGVRYTTRDQWHVTLRFLGECGEREAAAALDLVEADRCEATLGPHVSRFGRNVVVIPVSGLETVATAVISATRDLGEAPDPRPFGGHLTVARLRRRGSCRLAGAPIVASFSVTEIVLLRSRLGRGGARYELVARKPLAQP